MNLLNRKEFGCVDRGCISTTQTWKLREFLVRGYFVSGYDDTLISLGNLVGTANSTDVCVCRHDRETASPVGYERHLSQFRKSLLPLCRDSMAGGSSGGEGAA